jgi:hypothetical protein
MIIGAIRLKLHLPLCESLKDKRGRLKPLLERLRREFNVAAAETDWHDVWQTAEISVVTVSNEAGHAQAQLEHVQRWIEHNRPEVEVVDSQMELV